MAEKRIETDFLGELEIPADAYWGIHTERARRNFVISGRPVNPELVRAMALVKKACCQANLETGWLEESRAKAIIQACEEIARGRLADQFPVDALQGERGHP